MLSTALLCFKVEQRGVKSNYFGEDLGILKDYLGKQL